MRNLSIQVFMPHEARVTPAEKATVAEKSRGNAEVQKENRFLIRLRPKSRQPLSSRIGLAFLFSGALVLLASYLTSSTVLAFIGLGLTFWGGLFLFARPIKFVRSTILDSTAISSYATIDRITESLDYNGKPIYVPPYPKAAYLPDYLRGLKEMIVYIPAQNVATTPAIEEMARNQFLVRNPKGVCVPAPGYGLVNLIEKEIRDELTQISVERLFDSLPTIVTRSLEMAKEFEINEENGLIHIRMLDSVFQGLYSAEPGFKSIHSVGCPLTSAVACALSKTTARLVTVVKDAVSPDLRSIDVWFKTLEV